MAWTEQQAAALKAVDKWFYQESKKKQIFRVFGYAGTGKTTLANHFAENIDGLVCFAAFTGKAALVMRKNGCPDARTIHSLIYKAIVNEDTGEVTFEINKESALTDAALVVIDECSMVDEDLAKDLLSFRVPVLVLGDPAQLPPVSGAGYFTEVKPDVMLTEIHRQSKDNPIIYLATQVRNGIRPDLGEYEQSKVILKASRVDALEADQIIVGRNVTRSDMNMRIRRMLDHNADMPVPSDKLICLKNDKKLGIFNGGMFTLKRILKNKYKTQFFNMMLESDDEERPPLVAKIHKSFFIDEVPVPDWRALKNSQEFDYGYAITCHKSQGSQWDSVLIYDESWCFRDQWERWLYTAITRASEKVTIIVN